MIRLALLWQPRRPRGGGASRLRRNLDRDPQRHDPEHHRDRVPVRLAVLVHDRRRRDLQRSADGPSRRRARPAVSLLNDIEFQSAARSGSRSATAGSSLRSVDAGASWSPVALPNASDCKQLQERSRSGTSTRCASPERRVWLFGSGQGSCARTTRRSGSTRTSAAITAYNDSGFADAFFPTPDVGYIVEGDYSKVFFTANNLASAGSEKAGERRQRGHARARARGRSGEPEPHVVGQRPAVRALDHRVTRATAGRRARCSRIGNDSVREFPMGGAGRRRLRGRDRAGGGRRRPRPALDRRCDVLLQRRRRRARDASAGTRSGSRARVDGAVGGDGGRLALTAAANALPVVPVATPVPTPTPVATPSAYACGHVVHGRQGEREDAAGTGARERAREARRLGVLLGRGDGDRAQG